MLKDFNNNNLNITTFIEKNLNNNNNDIPIKRNLSDKNLIKSSSNVNENKLNDSNFNKLNNENENEKIDIKNPIQKWH